MAIPLRIFPAGPAGTTAEKPAYKVVRRKAARVRTSARLLLIDGRHYRMEFAEPGATPSKADGVITAPEEGDGGQFRLVPVPV